MKKREVQGIPFILTQHRVLELIVLTPLSNRKGKTPGGFVRTKCCDTFSFKLRFAISDLLVLP